jgi:hypothetical protein
MTRSVRTLRSAVVMNDLQKPLGDISTAEYLAATTAANFDISGDQWAEIEKAYGHKLSAPIRLKVLRVTTSFVLFEPFARAAPPLATAEKRAQAIKKSVEKFFGDLFSEPSDATVYADDVVDRHFDRRMPQLRALLLSLWASCNSSLAELKTSPGHREGGHWGQWIRDLTTILDRAGLPVAASKGRGKSKSDLPSSFVSFVLKLQNCVPDGAHRHKTVDAVATAIVRARGSKPRRPSAQK